MLFDLFRTHFGRLPVGLDGPTVSRGETVFKAGRVLSVLEEAPGRLAGEVEGSHGESYRTEVNLVLRGADTRVRSRCTCPVGVDCKHGAAVLLAWLRDLRDGVVQAAAAGDGAGARATSGVPDASATSAAPRAPVGSAAQPGGPRPAVAWAQARAPAADDERDLASAVRRQPLDGYERMRLLEWVRELHALKLPDGAPEPVAGSALYYVVRTVLRRPALTVYRIRRRADGGFAEPEQYPSLAAHAHAPPPFWDASDVQAATLLSGTAAPPAGAWAGIALDGQRAHDVLLLLAQAGKLYLDRPPSRADDAPLACGEPRPAVVAWQPDDDATPAPAAGALRLGLRPEPDAEVLYTPQPCWIDRTTRTLGPIAAPPPAALVSWLRGAPSVAPEAADEVALALHAQLRARPALRALVPSVSNEPVRERVGVPRPVIGLFTLRPRGPARVGQRPAPAGRETLAVSFAVEYEGRRMEPLRATSIGVRDDAGPVLLTCDPDAERAALSALRDALRDASGAEDGLALSPPPGPEPAGARARGGSGWFTVATLPAATVAAARIKFDVAARLAAQGWAVVDEAELPLALLEPDAVAIGLRRADAADAADGPTGAVSGAIRGPGEAAVGGIGWFELQSGIQVAGRRIDLAPILAQVIARGGFDAWSRDRAGQDVLWLRLSEQEVLKIDAARLEPLVRVVTDWAEVVESADGVPTLRLDAVAAAALAAANPDVPLPASLAALRELSTTFEGLRPVVPPPSFAATLRPYQLQGLAWLQFVAATGTGGVLADDMGLGKTVQVLAHLECERAAGRLTAPALVVAPTSLVFNWQDEARRHAPGLRVLALTGAARAERFAEIEDHDLVLTSYALLPRDIDAFERRRWHVVIADEAHLVKNARTRAAVAIHALRAAHRIALTGTPLENHLGELWSVMQFAVPALLGREDAFKVRFRAPIERRGGTPEAADRLRALERRIRPFLLRRTKAAVLSELPPRTDIVHRVELGREQRDLYESIRVTMDERVRHALAQATSGRGRIVVLDALLKLRQACCDPSLLAMPSARRVTASAKLESLRDLLHTLVEEGRRVLVFSQFTSMLDRIERAIDADPTLARVVRTRLDGDTDDRRGAVASFQNGDAQLFLLSLKAGGIGLNLTAADTVIHYDPWWNPAVESQATDRAHRIGQDKPVFVYKLIAAGTIEERILALQARKAELAQAVLAGGLTGDGLSKDDLLELFGPG
jgi:superfamily II DNA or RNA helicase